MSDKRSVSVEIRCATTYSDASTEPSLLREEMELGGLSMAQRTEYDRTLALLLLYVVTLLILSVPEYALGRGTDASVIIREIAGALSDGAPDGESCLVVVGTFAGDGTEGTGPRSAALEDTIMRSLLDRYLGKGHVTLYSWQMRGPLDLRAGTEELSAQFLSRTIKGKLLASRSAGFLVYIHLPDDGGPTAPRVSLIDISSGSLLQEWWESDTAESEVIAESEAMAESEVIPEPPADEAPSEVRAPVSTTLVTTRKQPAAPQMPQRSELAVKIVHGKGFIYEGQVDGSRKHGTGTITFDGGDTYTGEWKDDLMHGQGTYAYRSGNSYTGSWAESQMHGHGTYIYSDGAKYSGQWNRGRFHGTGTYTFESGDRFVGEWRDDKKHGKGAYHYANGDVWEGFYADDKRHGQSTFTRANGEQIEEYWENGEYVVDGP